MQEGNRRGSERGTQVGSGVGLSGDGVELMRVGSGDKG